MRITAKQHKKDAIVKATLSSLMIGALIIAASPPQTARADTHAPETEPKSWKDSSGLMEAAGLNINATRFMKEWNLQLGGWLNSSVSANMHSASDGFNGPVTFNDRSGEVQMNQLYAWLQKQVNVNSDSFDWGGRLDFMYGTDALFTQAHGVPDYDLRSGAAMNRGHWDLHLTSLDERFYGLALPQAYAEFNLPVGRGLSVKAGHFYSVIGYEVVTAPDSFFVSKSYAFQYGEPFTHTGVLGNYAVNDNWSVMAGAVTGSGTGGWDGGWDRQLGNWAFLGGGSWSSDDLDSSVSLTATAGGRSEHASSPWALYSLVGKRNLTGKLHYVFQHDHGFADQVRTAHTPRGGGTEDARWYGINQYLFYDIEDNLSVGMRAEWFRDHNGFRVSGPARCAASVNANNGTSEPYACGAGDMAAYPFAGSSYYAVTAGLSYKSAKWLTLRPNIRYDWADQVKAFDAGQRRNQLLFTADVVVSF